MCVCERERERETEGKVGSEGLDSRVLLGCMHKHMKQMEKGILHGLQGRKEEVHFLECTAVCVCMCMYYRKCKQMIIHTGSAHKSSCACCNTIMTCKLISNIITNTNSPEEGCLC